jgi:Putative lactococcus lactis phage r1t holin
MFTKAFAAATLERAVKTFAQTLAALLVADGTGLLTTAWVADLSIAGMAAVVSLLSSVASAGVSGNGPSLTSEHVKPAARHLAP